MQQFVLSIERIAGLMLAVVAALTFGDAALRYLFAIQIPDSFALSGMLQAIAIFWGIACATYHGRHITVDMLWEASGPSARRAIDTFAESVNFLFFAALTFMLWRKFQSQYASGETSNDLTIPLWPYVILAGVGVGCAAVMSLMRIVKINLRRA